MIDGWMPLSNASFSFRRLQTMKRRISGVTLFELIVVVIVTALLAVLLILSTQFLIIRTKISRVREEQRVLSRALQNYQMDYNALPSEQIGLRALTAPTAYLAQIPTDPFNEEVRRTYLYINPDGQQRRYALISAGPDGQLDVLTVLQRVRESSSSPGAHPASSPNSILDNWFQDYLNSRTYDPTNGSNSAGDIITLISNY